MWSQMKWKAKTRASVSINWSINQSINASIYPVGWHVGGFVCLLSLKLAIIALQERPRPSGGKTSMPTLISCMYIFSVITQLSVSQSNTLMFQWWNCSWMEAPTLSLEIGITGLRSSIPTNSNQGTRRKDFRQWGQWKKSLTFRCVLDNSGVIKFETSLHIASGLYFSLPMTSFSLQSS